MNARPLDVDRIAAVLFEHRSSGVTHVHDEEAERITGAHAWCYCGGIAGTDWLKTGPAWRGTFKLPADQAERELHGHIAAAIADALARSGVDA